MKSIVCVVLISLFIPVAAGQNPVIDRDSILHYFGQVRQATRENVRIWEKDIYGPIMLIDEHTRTVLQMNRIRQSAGGNGRLLYGGSAQDDQFSQHLTRMERKNMGDCCFAALFRQASRGSISLPMSCFTGTTITGFDSRVSDNHHLDEKEQGVAPARD